MGYSLLHWSVTYLCIVWTSLCLSELILCFSCWGHMFWSSCRFFNSQLSSNTAKSNCPVAHQLLGQIASKTSYSIYYLLCVCAHMGLYAVCRSVCWGQRTTYWSQALFSTVGSQGLNADHQAWRHMPLPTKPSHWTHKLYFVDPIFLSFYTNLSIKLSTFSDLSKTRKKTFISLKNHFAILAMLCFFKDVVISVLIFV